jgi:hypothetical protein
MGGGPLKQAFDLQDTVRGNDHGHEGIGGMVREDFGAVKNLKGGPGFTQGNNIRSPVI